jgi:hypothetical protein
MLRVRWSLFLCFGVLSACVSSKSTDSEESGKASDDLKAFILSDVPADIGSHIDADFEGKVILLGARVEPAGPAKPGDKLKVTMYWKSQQKLDGAWKLFTHIVDDDGQRISNIDNVGPLRELHSGRQALPPSEWVPGKVYVDEQTFTVPAKVKTDKIEIMTGIFHKGGRLTVTAGSHDAGNRALVTTIALTGVRPRVNTRIPNLHVEKLEPGVAIKLDGKLDEPAWKGAASTGPLVDVRTGEQNKELPVNGEVKVLWNDTGMYVGFSVTEADIVGGFKKGDVDPHLWTKDTVEIMVDPDGDGDNKDYYEIQVSPQNLVFDSQFDAYNEPKVEPNGPFGHQEWSSNLKSGVSVDGSIDKGKDDDHGYTVEVMIPWKSFSKALKVPPEVGASWRVNFYAMKNNGGVAWSPILGQGNFHKAARFGRIVWTHKGEAPAPGPSGSAPHPPLGGILKPPSPVAVPPPAAPTPAPAPSR